MFYLFLFSKVARQIFSASQHDSTNLDTEAKMTQDKGSDKESDQEQMVFSEFVEAIARLGVVKWSEELGTSSYLECIRRSIERCQTLINLKNNDF